MVLDSDGARLVLGRGEAAASQMSLLGAKLLTAVQKLKLDVERPPPGADIAELDAQVGRLRESSKSKLERLGELKSARGSGCSTTRRA